MGRLGGAPPPPGPAPGRDQGRDPGGIGRSDPVQPVEEGEPHRGDVVCQQGGEGVPDHGARSHQPLEGGDAQRRFLLGQESREEGAGRGIGIARECVHDQDAAEQATFRTVETRGLREPVPREEGDGAGEPGEGAPEGRLPEGDSVPADAGLLVRGDGPCLGPVRAEGTLEVVHRVGAGEGLLPEDGEGARIPGGREGGGGVGPLPLQGGVGAVERRDGRGVVPGLGVPRGVLLAVRLHPRMEGGLLGPAVAGGPLLLLDVTGAERLAEIGDRVAGGGGCGGEEEAEGGTDGAPRQDPESPLSSPHVDTLARIRPMSSPGGGEFSFTGRSWISRQ